MTAKELESLLQEMHWQSLSDEELADFLALSIAFKAKILQTIQCREYFKTHFSSENK